MNKIFYFIFILFITIIEISIYILNFKFFKITPLTDEKNYKKYL